MNKKQRLILGMLGAKSPQYGVELVRRSGGFLRRAAAHVHFAGLEEAGLVEREDRVAIGEGESSRPSRIYTLTDRGRKAVKEMLSTD